MNGERIECYLYFSLLLRMKKYQQLIRILFNSTCCKWNRKNVSFLCYISRMKEMLRFLFLFSISHIFQQQNVSFFNWVENKSYFFWGNVAFFPGKEQFFQRNVMFFVENLLFSCKMLRFLPEMWHFSPIFTFLHEV